MFYPLMNNLQSPFLAFNHHFFIDFLFSFFFLFLLYYVRVCNFVCLCWHRGLVCVCVCSDVATLCRTVCGGLARLWDKSRAARESGDWPYFLSQTPDPVTPAMRQTHEGERQTLSLFAEIIGFPSSSSSSAGPAIFSRSNTSCDARDCSTTHISPQLNLTTGPKPARNAQEGEGEGERERGREMQGEVECS